jgi:hypothetical protein
MDTSCARDRAGIFLRLLRALREEGRVAFGPGTLAARAASIAPGGIFGRGLDGLGLDVWIGARCAIERRDFGLLLGGNGGEFECHEG